MQNVPVAFPALIVLERRVRDPALFFVVVVGFVLCKMDEDILDAVGGFGVKKVEGVMGRGQMAVHAVRHKPLGIVHMGRGFPGVVGKLNFMA